MQAIVEVSSIDPVRMLEIIICKLFQMENSGVVHMLKTNKTDGKFTSSAANAVLIFLSTLYLTPYI